MIFPFFQYYKAPSLNEALGFISKLKDSFVFMSGGTDLTPQIKQETVYPKHVVSLYGIPELSQVKNQDFISIGSQVTLSDLASNPIISKHLPWLSEIISNIATPQIRNRATVGGNLLANNRCIYYNQSLLIRSAHSLCFKAGGEVCHLIPNVKHSDTPLCQARFISDLAAVFLLLDAYVILKSKDIERKVKLREFYLPDGIKRNILKSGEILTHIEIVLPQKAKIYYKKLRVRNAIDFASLGIGMNIIKTGQDITIGVVLIGVNTYPIFLQSKDKDFLSSEATKLALPLKRQDFFPPSYRRQMISQYIQDGYTKLMELRA